ncbi:hypothetical protein HDV05_007731 [Chytridiales sp. JEL 0842]|nr:hypothetical protein HDV05_007731 [Chytridiales sp. JEL 0842]
MEPDQSSIKIHHQEHQKGISLTRARGDILVPVLSASSSLQSKTIALTSSSTSTQYSTTTNTTAHRTSSFIQVTESSIQRVRTNMLGDERSGDVDVESSKQLRHNEILSELPQFTDSDIPQSIIPTATMAAKSSSPDPSIELLVRGPPSPLEQPTPPDVFLDLVQTYTHAPSGSLHLSLVLPLLNELTSPPCQLLILPQKTITMVQEFCDGVLAQKADCCLTAEELWGLLRSLRESSKADADKLEEEEEQRLAIFETAARGDEIEADGYATEGNASFTVHEVSHNTSQSPSATSPPSSDNENDSTNALSRQSSPSSKNQNSSPTSFGRKRTTPLLSQINSASWAASHSRRRSGSASSTSSSKIKSKIGYTATGRHSPVYGSSSDPFGSSISSNSSSSSSPSPLGATRWSNPSPRTSGSQTPRFNSLGLGGDSDDQDPTPTRIENQNSDVFYTPRTTFPRNKIIPPLSSFSDFSESASFAESDESTIRSPTVGHVGFQGQLSHGGKMWNDELSSGAPSSPAVRRKLFPESGLPGAWKKGFISSDSETDDTWQRTARTAAELSKKLQDTERRLSQAQRYSEERLHEMQIKVDELTAEVTNKKRAIVDLKATEKKHLSQIEAMEQAAAKVAKDLEEAKAQYSLLKLQIERQAENETLLMQELKVKEYEIQSSQLSLDTFHRDLKKTLDDNAALEEEAQTLHAQIQEAEELMAALAQENYQLKQTIEGLQSNMAQLSIEREYLGKDLKTDVKSAKSLHHELSDSAYESEMSPEDLLVCILSFLKVSQLTLL